MGCRVGKIDVENLDAQSKKETEKSYDIRRLYRSIAGT
jgi:hypothetical protein